MTTLYFFMLSVFILYVGFIWLRYGIQPSISESYYVLPNKWKFLFTLFCWGFAVPAIIIGNTLLMFLAGSAIAFVGAAAAFKEKMTREVHLIGAYSGVLLSQIAIFVDFKMWYLNVAFVVFALYKFFIHKNYKVWYVEIAAFLAICIALIKHVW